MESQTSGQGKSEGSQPLLAEPIYAYSYQSDTSDAPTSTSTSTSASASTSASTSSTSNEPVVIPVVNAIPVAEVVNRPPSVTLYRKNTNLNLREQNAYGLLFFLIFLAFVSCCCNFGANLHEIKYEISSTKQVDYFTWKAVIHQVDETSTTLSYSEIIDLYRNFNRSDSSPSNCRSTGRALLALSVFGFLICLLIIVCILFLFSKRFHLIPKYGETIQTLNKFLWVWVCILNLFFFFIGVVWSSGCMTASQHFEEYQNVKISVIGTSIGFVWAVFVFLLFGNFIFLWLRKNFKDEQFSSIHSV